MGIYRKMAFVSSCRPFYFQFFGCIAKIITRQIRSCHRQIPRIAHLQFPFLRLYGFDDHDPISCPRTVDCFCSRIFQQRDRCHPVHIQVEYFLCRCLKTIQNKQRLVGIWSILTFHIRQTRSPANLNIRHPVRVTTKIHALCNHKGGIHIFQTLQYILITQSLQILLFESRCSTCKTLSLANKNTCHNHFLHLCHLFCQYNFHRHWVGLFQNFTLCLISNKRKFQFSLCHR